MKFVLLALTLFSFNFSVAKTAPQKKYGKGITLKKSIGVTELLAKQDNKVDEVVQVTGRIKKVCPMMGCWLELEDPKTNKLIKVKVEDGVIVFPKDAAGKMATVEGTLTKETMSKRKAISYYRHLAKELGEKFDPKSITGPMDLWQIQGTGALIQQ